MKTLSEIATDIVDKMLSEGVETQGYVIKPIEDISDFLYYAEDVWNMLEMSYHDIGGLQTYRNYNDFYRKRPYMEVVVKNNELLACATYRRIESSLKMVAIGCNQTPEGKLALQQIIQHNITHNDLHYWAEVSGAIEYYFKKHQGFPIPNTLAAEVLQVRPSQIILSNRDAVHYERPIGPQGEYYEKMIYGFKNEEIYKKTLAEVDNYSQFMEEVNNIKESTVRYTVKQAIYIIENIYRAHEEDGFNELVPSWHKALLDSLSTLHNAPEQTETVQDYIKYCEYLLSDMQILEMKQMPINNG